MNDHTRKLNGRLRALKVQPPPEPWERVSTHAVNGLTEVGYAEGSDWLLVVSSQGRGLFDCLSGERTDRDYAEPASDVAWYDDVRLVAYGIGAIERQLVRLSGLHGGGLPRCTSDRWSLELVAPDWPITGVVLSPPHQSVYIESHSAGCVKVAEDYEIRAYGFSDTGRSFAVAMNHTLEIYARPDVSQLKFRIET